jgi:hypothetical protein
MLGIGREEDKEGEDGEKSGCLQDRNALEFVAGLCWMGLWWVSNCCDLVVGVFWEYDALVVVSRRGSCGLLVRFRVGWDRGVVNEQPPRPSLVYPIQEAEG